MIGSTAAPGMTSLMAGISLTDCMVKLGTTH